MVGKWYVLFCASLRGRGDRSKKKEEEEEEEIKK